MDKTIDTKTGARIIMVTGGQRSGKSAFAESLALDLSLRPAYVATALVEDDEMRLRVEKHQQRRQQHWRNIEEPYTLSAIDLHENEVALIDCLTLWASNWFFRLDADVDAAMSAMKKELDAMFRLPGTLIFVTNEIGLGGTSTNAIQRRFTDLQGLINQYVAAAAHEVYLTVSGIPVKIK